MNEAFPLLSWAVPFCQPVGRPWDDCSYKQSLFYNSYGVLTQSWILPFLLTGLLNNYQDCQTILTFIFISVSFLCLSSCFLCWLIKPPALTTLNSLATTFHLVSLRESLQSYVCLADSAKVFWARGKLGAWYFYFGGLNCGLFWERSDHRYPDLRNVQPNNVDSCYHSNLGKMSLLLSVELPVWWEAFVCAYMQYMCIYYCAAVCM